MLAWHCDGEGEDRDGSDDGNDGSGDNKEMVVTGRDDDDGSGDAMAYRFVMASAAMVTIRWRDDKRCLGYITLW